MGVLLIPWLALWVVLPIHAQIGASIAILASLYMIGNNRYEHTPYDGISAVTLTLLSLIALLSLAPLVLILTVGKLIWAAMWLVSVVRKIPLSAYYSCYGYGLGGPQKAFHNQLFLKTNRIIAFGWGLQSILMSMLAWFFLQTELAPFFGLLDQLAPLLMGVFTVWFAKWYPAKVAMGDVVKQKSE